MSGGSGGYDPAKLGSQLGGKLTQYILLMRTLVSRTALGSTLPVAGRRRVSNSLYGLSGITIGLSRRLCAVLCPYPVEHSEKSIAFCRQCLVSVKINHCDDRFPVLFNDDCVLLAGHPPNQLGKGILGSLIA